MTTDNRKIIYYLTINSRPDTSGRVWFMVTDRSDVTGEHYAGHLAHYMTASPDCRWDVAVESQIFAGVKLDSAGPVIAAVSRYFHGNSRALIFSHMEDGQINADGSANTVGPVLHLLAIVEQELT